MGNLINFFSKLFDTSDFPPRWHCGNWSQFHGWLYIVSDLLIWSAYFAIPVIIIQFISKRAGARFHKVYFLFAAFILSCGATHLLDAVAFWIPLYRLSALVRFITGVISWFTVFHLIRILPDALSLKTNAQLQAEVDQRKQAEQDLQLKNTQLNEAQSIARMGSWEWNVRSNKVTWTDGLFAVYGLTSEKEGLNYERFLQHVHPDDRDFVDSIIMKSFAEKKFTDYYHRIVTPEGKIKTLQAKGEVVLDEKGDIVKMIGTGQDISEQKQVEQELLIKTTELQEVNTELQKFAYVASHDLQEPLRKIKTFISRLQTENTALITDAQSLTYLGKINNATVRMQQLMDDILDFSRVSSSSFTYQELNLNEVLQGVLSDIEVLIETSGASIKADALQVIEANATQMGQLFLNLISNAIKFRKPGMPPVIHIIADVIKGSEVEFTPAMKAHYKFSDWDKNNYWSREKFCRISVRDEGIGFEGHYFERIFQAFERLHNSSQYEGTGIGLAICRKIVDHHHGSITAESSPGAGSTFTIILPLSQQNFSNIPSP